MEKIDLASTAQRAAAAEASTTDDFGRPSEIPLTEMTATTIGSYRIEGLLGEGGMGRVYLARQENPARKVALKVMAPGRLNERAMRRFEYEAETLARLQHPGIAQVYEAGAAKSADGSIQPFFAMEYIEGSTLLKFMRDARLNLSQKLSLIAEIADAVEHAHRRGVVHRDLKPGNIVVDRDGRPKVLDFGVARIADVNRDATEVGSIVGTLAYMSPEQASGDPSAVDTRSDVYSLGVVMYQALSGVLPIDLAGKTTLEAIRTIAEARVVPLDQRDKSIPSDAAAIAAKAIATDKELRYSSAAEFAADLRRFLASEPIQARTPSTWYTFKKFVQRKRAQAAAIIAGGLAVAVALVVVSISLVQVSASHGKELAQQRVAAVESTKAQHSSARRLMQRGDWRGALLSLQSLDSQFLDDPVERDLDVAQALVAVNRRADARDLLESLKDRRLGGREADALLLRADFAMAESANDGSAESMLQQALALGTLAKSDAAYAEGLLAEKTTTAVERFRKALAVDPYHRSARAALVFLLTVLGEHDEAVRVGEIGRAIYPDDPNFVFSLAIIAALNGDRGRAKTVLDGARLQMGAKATADLANVVDFIVDVQPALGKISRGAAGTEIMPAAVRFAAIVQRINGDGTSPWASSIPSLPCLRKSFAWAGTWMFRIVTPLPLSTKEESSLADAIDKAMTDHPDAMLAAFAASLRMPSDAMSGHESYRQTNLACERLEKAVRMKTFLPVALRSTKAAALATLSQLALIAKDGKAPPDLNVDDQRRRLCALAEFCVTSEPFEKEIWNLSALCAALGQDYRLSRRIAEEWAVRSPTDDMPKVRVISAEIKLGNSSGALRKLDELEPKLKGSYLEEPAKRFRAEALADLKSLSAKLK